MFASSGCYSSILVNEIYSLVGRVNTWSLALLWNYMLYFDSNLYRPVGADVIG